MYRKKNLNIKIYDRQKGLREYIILFMINNNNNKSKTYKYRREIHIRTNSK